MINKKQFSKQFKKKTIFFNKNQIFFLSFIFLSIFLSIKIIFNNPVRNGVYSDVATHIMQSISLAHNQNLIYEEADLDVYFQHGWTEPPSGIFLNKWQDQFFYSKPYLYSLFSSPFVYLFNSWGPLILNALCLLVIFTLFYFSNYNKKKYYSVDNLLLALIGAFLIIFSPYSRWLIVIHPDIFISLLIFLTFFFIKEFIEKRSSMYLFFSSIFMGFSIFEKPPFIIFLVPILYFLLINKVKIKTIAIFLIISFLSIIVISIPNYMNYGELISYRGERWYYKIPPFLQENPIGEETNTASFFTIKYAVNKLRSGLLNLPTSAYYYLLGLHTGLLVYFPTILVFLPNFFRNLKRNKFFQTVVIGIFLYILSYILLLYFNYYGGSGSFGNRYFLQIYALLFFLFNRNLFTREINKSYLRFFVLFLPAFTIYAVFNQSQFSHVKYIHSFGNFISKFHTLPIEKTMYKAIGQPRPVLKISDELTIYLWNSYYPENTKVWIDGNTRSRFLLISEKKLIGKNITFNLETLVPDNLVKVWIENKKVISENIINSKKYVLPIDKDQFFYDQNNEKKYSIEIQIKASKSAIPKQLLENSNDLRSLGVKISKIEIE